MKPLSSKKIIEKKLQFWPILPGVLLLLLCVSTVVIVPVTLSAQTWTHSGPFGGYITALTIDPVDTGVVYAGTYGGGMFRSTNGGLNWVDINNDFPLLNDTTIGIPPTFNHFWLIDYYPVTLIRVDPSNRSNLYAGTLGAGIIQSENMGETWTMTNEGLPYGSIPTDLWINPENPSVMLCGTDYPTGGLFRTVNNGQSWELVNGMPSGSSYQITNITHEPGNSDIIYVGFTSVGEPGLPWGLLRSSDGGNEWGVVYQDMPIYNLQIEPDNTQNLWGVGYTGYLDWMLFYSNDRGSSWEPYPDMYDPWLWVAVLYADADWNLYTSEGYDPIFESPVLRKSTDHGDSWQTLPISLPSSPMGIRPGYGPNMAANPLRTEIIYFGTRSGVFRSDDGGETAELRENGMINTYILDVKVNPNNPSIVYACGPQGLWKSVDAGESWVRLNTSKVRDIAIDPHHPDTVYWGGKGLMRSYDGGETWEDIGSTILPGSGGVTTIEIHPDSTNIIFIGVYPSTFYKTNNWGDDWTLSYSAGAGAFSVNDIAIDKINPDMVYFGASGSPEGFYRSSNGGLSWERISDPGGVISIAIHPVPPETIYITAGGNLKVSYNRGETFELLAEDVEGHRIVKIFIDPLAPSHFLVTTGSGVFYSTDEGLTWSLLAGPYYPSVHDLYYVSSIKRIYIATHGDRVWVGDGVTLSVDGLGEHYPLPETVHLLPAYPNPLNTQTVIPFFVNEQMQVTVAIYNIEGQLVKNLAHRDYLKGFHYVNWDGTTEKGQAVTSGIYLVQLRGKSSTTTEKITLLR